MSQFHGQHDDENVLMVFRRHPIAMRKGFYVLLVPFLLGSLPTLIWPENINFLWISLGGFGLGLLGFFYFWMGWYFSVFIITDQRIRMISQRGFYNRSVIDVALTKIQNMIVNVPGFSATIFKFGTITVQTYVGDLILDRLHDPEKIYDDLLKIVNEHTKGIQDNTYEETSQEA
ncbi:PH domain-containing protein [Candidatus Saccharibacteria bacterium]|nr:PH domain-containing protein [Candidatus Saccharibacteria bacterium]